MHTNTSCKSISSFNFSDNGLEISLSIKSDAHSYRIKVNGQDGTLVTETDYVTLGQPYSDNYIDANSGGLVIIHGNNIINDFPLLNCENLEITIIYCYGDGSDLSQCLGRTTLVELPCIVAPAPNLFTAVKTASDINPSVNDIITYSITLTTPVGNGSDVTGINVQDTLPAGVTYQAGSITGTGNNDAFGVVLIWDIPTMAPNSTEVLTYQVMVNSLGTQTNLVDILGSNTGDLPLSTSEDIIVS